MILYVGKILIYIILAAMLYFIGGKVIVFRTKSGVKKDNFSKISFGAIIVFSALFGWYSTICSELPYSLDRGNYVVRFVRHWENPWTTGLNTVADFLHTFTNEPKALFFFITFLCVFLYLIAYKISRESDRNTLLLFLCSSGIIYSFYALKQAPSMTFATLGIIFLLKRKRVLSIVFLVVSISFHEAAYILIPLYVVLLTPRKSIFRNLSYLILIICIFFFSGISRFSLNIIGDYFPNIMEQVEGYMDESGALKYNLNILTAIKGIPYYIITIYGIIKYPALREKIYAYDDFLFMSVFVSVTVLLSSYMYWMWRFGAYCCFPVFIFASAIYREDDNRNNAQSFISIVALSLAFLTIRYLCRIYFLYGGF